MIKNYLPQYIPKYIPKPNLITSIFVILILLIVGTVLAWQLNKINDVYAPYVADSISLVYKDQGDFAKLKSDEFVLSDAKNLKASGKNVAIIDSASNQAADLEVITQNAAGIYVDLFSSVNPDRSFTNVFDANTVFSVKSFLSDQTDVSMKYDPTGQKLSFVLSGQSINVNGSAVKLNDVDVFTVNDIKSDSFLLIGDLIVDLSNYKNDVVIPVGNLRQGIAQYKLTSANLFAGQNNGFEQGLWESNVTDCSAYLPGVADISMSLTTDAHSGGSALRLTSSNHFACTLKKFDVDLSQNNLYRLSFDYRNVAGGQVNYYYDLRNDLDQTQEKFGSFEAPNNSWNNFSTTIIPSIDGAKNVNVYFYAPSKGDKKIVNQFDDLALTTFEFDKKINLPLDKINTNIVLANYLKLATGDNTFDYTADNRNLLADYNPSFADGLWPNTVSDCSNYLPGEADFGIKLNNDGSDGSQALEIYSANHFACLFNSFPVALQGDKIYKLNFDYKNVAGSQVQYYYSLINDAGLVQDGFDNFEDRSMTWQTKQIIIDPNLPNLKSFDLYFYAASDGSQPITNLYDNISLTQIAPSDIYSYFLFAKRDLPQTPKVSSLEFKTLGRFQDQVILHGFKDSALLVYPRQYTDSWSLYDSHGSAVAVNRHYQVDGFGNAWWLDVNELCGDGSCQQNGDGSYDLTLTISNSAENVLPYFRILIALLLLLLLFAMFYVWKK